MNKKRVPLRQCIGCGQMIDKNSLIRVVKDKQQNIELDLTLKKQGRGAYLCNNIECLKKARKTNRLARCFSQKIPDEIYEQMEKELENR